MKYLLNRYYLLARLREILHDLTIDALAQDNSIPMRLLQLPPCEEHQHHHKQIWYLKRKDA